MAESNGLLGIDLIVSRDEAKRSLFHHAWEKSEMCILGWSTEDSEAWHSDSHDRMKG